MANETSSNIGIIYCLKCPNTNIIRYIGQTIQPLELRLKQHLWYSSKKNNHLGFWLKSLNKNPIIEVIERCNYLDLDSKEIHWINHFYENKLVNSMKGCMLSGHHTHSEETKKKIAIHTIRVHTGLKRSDETKAKIRAPRGDKLKNIYKCHSEQEIIKQW